MTSVFQFFAQLVNREAHTATVIVVIAMVLQRGNFSECRLDEFLATTWIVFVYNPVFHESRRLNINFDVAALVNTVPDQQFRKRAFFPQFGRPLPRNGIKWQTVPKRNGIRKLFSLLIVIAQKALENVDLLANERFLRRWSKLAFVIRFFRR